MVCLRVFVCLLACVLFGCGSRESVSSTYVFGRIAERDIIGGLAGQYGWESEVRTRIGTRCDLVSDDFAIEVERIEKWKEAVGQALHYSVELDRMPVCCFMVQGHSDAEKAFIVSRIGDVAFRHCIELWFVDVDSLAIERLEPSIP